MLGLAVAALMVGANPAPADAWPHWRGPHADGTAPQAKPPLTWDAASGKNIKWKATLPGRGSATPVVWGNRIFVLSAAKTDRVAKDSELPRVGNLQKRTTAPNTYYRFLVTCIDRETGKTVWEKVATEQIPHEGHHETHSYAAGSPTTDGKRLFASFGSFGIYCYDLDGNLQWKRDLGRLQTRLGWGEAVTPVVHGDALLVNWDQEENAALYCLDANTGETRWKADREEKSTWTTPLVTEFNGKTQVIMNGNNRVRSYDITSGEVIWAVGGMTMNPIPSALRYQDAAIIVSGYRGAAAVSVPLASTGDLGTSGQVNWRYGKGTPYVPSPVLVNGKLYFTEMNQNLLTVLDARTGEPIMDKERLPGVGQFYASPLFAGGRVYLTDRSGTTLVLAPGEGIEVLATNKLNDPVDASPVAVGNQLYLRSHDTLYCIAEGK